MLSTYTAQEWDALIENTSNFTLWQRAVFVEKTALVVGAKPVFLVWKLDGKPVIGLAAYEKSNKLINQLRMGSK